MPRVETEVKFHLSDPAGLRCRLMAMGASSSGRALEHNIRFEDKGRNLLREKALLRLRRERKAVLTYKSTPTDADPAFKQFNELEVEVADFDAMQGILMSLGFNPEQVYEKWRETLVVDQTSFCLDTLPFGDFLEIEGSKDAITHFTSRLGLEWSRRILLNYLEIFDLIRHHHGLPFRDVTFDNFADAAIHLDAVLPLLQTGVYPSPAGLRSTP
jgi:adenylate cyclase class 2